MKIFTRDDTEHGVEYVRKSDADSALATETERIRNLVRAITDSRYTYGWGPEADAAIDAARVALEPNAGNKGPAARPVPLD